MSKSQLFLIIFILLVVLLLPYSVKSNESNKDAVREELNQVCTLLDG